MRARPSRLDSVKKCSGGRPDTQVTRVAQQGHDQPDKDYLDNAAGRRRGHSLRQAGRRVDVRLVESAAPPDGSLVASSGTFRLVKEGSDMATVSFKGATRIYPGTDTPAVNKLGLDIEDGSPSPWCTARQRPSPKRLPSSPA